MLFGKYHIVILRERGGSCRNLFMRGWCGIAGVLFVASLMGLTIWLAGKYLHTYEVEQRLAEAEKTIEEQSTQLLAMTGKL